MKLTRKDFLKSLLLLPLLRMPAIANTEIQIAFNEIEKQYNALECKSRLELVFAAIRLDSACIKFLEIYDTPSQPATVKLYVSEVKRMKRFAKQIHSVITKVRYVKHSIK